MVKNNIVYMWSSKQHPYVWKIGVSTGMSIGLSINNIAEQARLDIDRIYHTGVLTDARTIKSEILTHGVPFNFGWKFNGYTMFRELSNKDLDYVRETFGIAYSDIGPIDDVILNKGKSAPQRKKIESVNERNTVDEWKYKRIVKEVVPGHDVDCWKLYYPSSFNHKHLLYYIRHICDATSYIFEVDKCSIVIYNDGVIDEYLKWLHSIDFSDVAIDKWAKGVNLPVQRSLSYVRQAKSKWHTVSVPLANNNDAAYDEQSWCTYNTLGLWGSGVPKPIWDYISDIDGNWCASIIFYFDNMVDVAAFKLRWL